MFIKLGTSVAVPRKPTTEDDLTGNNSTNRARSPLGQRGPNQELKDAPQGQPGEEDVRDVKTS